jgi:ATP-binding cassette subfamily B protein
MMLLLPLETLTDEASKAFAAHGVDTGVLELAVALDLDAAGDYGESWVAYSKTLKRIYVIAASFRADGRISGFDPNASAKSEAKKAAREKSVAKDFNYFHEYDIHTFHDVYVDNFVCSNRVLARVGEPLPDKEPEKDGEHVDLTDRPKVVEDYNKLKTEILAFSTNARKRKLFAFIDIVNRLRNGDDITDADPIFEQFNVRCPKCGRIYADQNRKICEH